jgi:hypothetical protein
MYKYADRPLARWIITGTARRSTTRSPADNRSATRRSTRMLPGADKDAGRPDLGILRPRVGGDKDRWGCSGKPDAAQRGCSWGSADVGVTGYWPARPAAVACVQAHGAGRPRPGNGCNRGGAGLSVRARSLLPRMRVGRYVAAPLQGQRSWCAPAVSLLPWGGCDDLPARHSASDDNCARPRPGLADRAASGPHGSRPRSSLRHAV